MKKFKILALSALVMVASNSVASNQMEVKVKHCMLQDIQSTTGYSFEKSSNREIKMCLEKSKEGYKVIEDSFVYGQNEYKISGFKDKDFNQIESISNLNGKLVIKTKSKKIYTGDMGYVLTNKEYLPLKNNNEIVLTEETVSNVDKTIYSGELVVFTQDKKVLMKGKEGWEQLPLRNVVDVAQSRFGSYFILTKTGVFAKMQESDNRTTDSRERGVFYRFDRANIATIPVKSLRFKFVENDPDKYFRLVMDNKANERETFYVYFSVDKALISKEGKVSEKQMGLQQPKLKSGVIEATGTRTNATDISIERVEKSVFGSFHSPYLNENHLSTKYNGIVDLDYKEKLGLLSHPVNVGKVGNFSNIVKILESEEKDKVYILRDNGMLQIFDKKNYVLLKRIENVKSITLDNRDDVEINK